MTQNNKEASASFFNGEFELAQTHHDLKRFSHHYVLDDADYQTWLSWRMKLKLRRQCKQAKELNHDHESRTDQDAPVNP